MWKTLGKTPGGDRNIAKHKGKQAHALINALLLHGKQKVWKTVRKTLDDDRNMAKQEGKQARSLFNDILLHCCGKQEVWKTLLKMVGWREDLQYRGGETA